MVLLVLLLLRIQRVIQLLPPLRNQPILLLLFATNSDGDFRAQGRMLNAHGTEHNGSPEKGWRDSNGEPAAAFFDGSI
jgi:hypothetical protein